MLPVVHAHHADRESMCSNRMSHDGSDQRCASIDWVQCTENVAESSYPDDMESAQVIMAEWWESEGHKNNILRTDATKGGVGRYKCPNGKFYYTALFE
jgi:uncharacterized protein YkwD